jgi:hypothetical protein
MSGAKPSPDRYAVHIALVEQCLREGFEPSGGQRLRGPGTRTAVAEAANRLNPPISYEGFLGNLKRAKSTYGMEPDWSLYRPRVYLHKGPQAPIIPSQDHTVEPPPEGDILDVAVIGDAHDSPHLPDKSRFEWMGRYIAENRIPWVVSIGDWLTMDSLSSHTDPATFEGLAKPTFEQDMESFHASQRAFRRGLGDWKPKMDLIYGNHDGERPKRWANVHREVVGGRIDPALAVEEALAQWGWRTTPYGEYRFIGGVGFIHAPLIPGTAGKTYGGKTGGQRAANDAMFDIIRGDDHKFYVASSPKIGPVRSPKVFGTATALPPGYIEAYARKNAGDWETGICRFTIWGGRVQSFAFEGMNVLRHRYGAREAA